MKVLKIVLALMGFVINSQKLSTFKTLLFFGLSHALNLWYFAA